ncbi:SRPBCC family protein [Nocardia panacis]|uniref:SRPBCC family protein n=1 Tax=Nocardia panacis TaxID=2340916 RepID=A0A3A4K8K7_9NOCA|nr:SRPBCC family protein [Nocardia panacis]RJO69317.1 SRPBCC family protein [Nocardia panacis]
MTYTPTPPHRIELVEADGHWSLIFHREFPQAPDSVWSALTDPDELREWAPYSADRAMDKPGPVTLLMAGADGSTELPGEISIAERPTLLEFTWGGDPIRWELSPRGSGTALRLTQRIPAPGAAAMIAAGWHICLDVAEYLLAGSPIGPIVGAAAMDHGWSDLNIGYSQQLGIEPMDPPNAG